MALTPQQQDKVHRMLALEAMGKLPPDYQLKLEALRSQGIVPAGPDVDNPQDAQRPSANTQALIDQNMPWMKEATGSNMRGRITDPALSSQGTGADENIVKQSPPTDWIKAGNDTLEGLIAKIPAMTATALGAAPLAAGPEGILAAPLTGGYGYNAGRMVTTPLQKLMGYKVTDPGAIADTISGVTEGMGAALGGAEETIPNAMNLGKEVMGAGKQLVGKVANLTKIPQNVIAKRAGLSADNPLVNQYLDAGLPYRGGGAESALTSAQKEVYSPVTELLNQASQEGKMGNVGNVIQGVRDYAAKMRGINEFERADAIDSFADKMSNLKEMPIDKMQAAKQASQTMVRDYDLGKSMNESSASMAGRRVYNSGLRDEIANQTADPEAVHAANKAYGSLEDLVPLANKFDRASPKESVTGNLTGMVAQPIVRGLRALQKVGGDVNPIAYSEGPQTFSEMVNPTATTEGFPGFEPATPQQKLLPSPGMKTTSTGATLTPDDLGVLQGIQDPDTSFTLKELLRMNPTKHGRSSVPTQPPFGRGEGI